MEATSISLPIVENTLRQMDMLRVDRERGQVLVVDREGVERRLAKLNKPGPRVEAGRIHWAPLPCAPKDKWRIANIRAAVAAAPVEEGGGGGAGAGGGGERKGR